MYQNVAIAAFSCDIYEEVWKVFYRSFDRYWPDHPQIYICNEFIDSKSEHYTNLTYKDKNVNNWNRNIYDCIKDLDYEYIIFMDCDHIPIFVDYSKIVSCIDVMNNDKSIGFLRFLKTNDCIVQNSTIKIDDMKFNLQDEHNIGSKCQSAIWRKQCLLNELIPHENMNPWEWESSISAQSYKYYQPSDYDSGKIINYLYSGCVSDGYWKVEYFTDVIDIDDDIYKDINFLYNGFICNNINDEFQIKKFKDKFLILYKDEDPMNYLTSFYKGIHESARNPNGLTNDQIIKNIQIFKN